MDADGLQGFPDEIVEAVLRHMNDDHLDDSLVIVRANGAADAIAARMTGVDALAGTWVAETATGPRQVRIAWSRPIAERAEIRAEIVRLHARAVTP